MAGMVQKRVQFIDNTMHHHALIKILIEFHLKSIGDTWDDFLFRNHFQEKEEKHPSDKKGKIGRKRKTENLDEDEQPPQPQSEDEIPIA